MTLSQGCNCISTASNSSCRYIVSFHQTMPRTLIQCSRHGLTDICCTQTNHVLLFYCASCPLTVTEINATVTQQLQGSSHARMCSLNRAYRLVKLEDVCLRIPLCQQYRQNHCRRDVFGGKTVLFRLPMTCNDEALHCEGSSMLQRLKRSCI